MGLKPGYKQTEAGVIPEDWKLRPLLSAVHIARGQVDPKAEPYRSMTLVAPDHIESGSGRLLKKETASDQRAISGKYLFTKGDIVYSKIRPYLRKAILADFDGLCSADMYPLKPVSDVSAGFILAAILGHHFSKYAESVSVRSGMPKINREELAEYTIALPPAKAEQETIAEALSDTDNLIESLEQLIAKKRQIKQGAMQELLTGKRRLAGFEGKRGYKQTEVGVIPEGWSSSMLGPMMIRVANGLVYRQGKSTRYPVTRIETIADGSIDMERVGYAEPAPDIEKYRLQAGDILFSHINSVDHIGKVAIYRGGSPLYHGMNLLLLRAGDKIDAEYLYYWLGSSGGRRKSMSLARKAVSQASINTTEVREMLVPLPPTKAEQTAIATILSDMDTEITALEAKLAKAREIKQGMMQELLTGRIRLV